jgi:hypothetical protein
MVQHVLAAAHYNLGEAGDNLYPVLQGAVVEWRLQGQYPLPAYSY